MTAPRVIGLDLSLTATGIAYADGNVEVLDTPASKKIKGVVHRFDGPGRLVEIRHACFRAIDGEYGHPVDLAVIEGYSMGQMGNRQFALGELGGVVRVNLYENRVPYLLVPPNSLKKFATGNGLAKKPEMVANARERLGYDGFLEDAADALWLRALGLHVLGAPLCQLPKKHLEALAKLPEIVRPA